MNNTAFEGSYGDDDDDDDFFDDDVDIVFTPSKARYDDDHLNFYKSNIDKEKYPNKKEYQDAIDAQPISLASTYDLIRELDKRFDQVVMFGKRKLLIEKLEGNRDSKRDRVEVLDNRFFMRGDTHTLYGMATELKEHAHYSMGEGLSYIKFGYGPGEEATDMNGMDQYEG